MNNIEPTFLVFFSFVSGDVIFYLIFFFQVNATLGLLFWISYIFYVLFL